ncbi:hypothetical protein BJ741DRAFT_672291 [Chytriomyces cf. hyalinus JEL632]|nr:hypothetical protein BJ741DRAFT_672291 [Chytriomyces cf. hyalinus JEL632]
MANGTALLNQEQQHPKACVVFAASASSPHAVDAVDAVDAAATPALIATQIDSVTLEHGRVVPTPKLLNLLSPTTTANKPGRALSPKRKGNDHPIKSPNLEANKVVAAVPVPVVSVEKTANDPVNEEPPVSVTQNPPATKDSPLEDTAKAVEDTADVPAKDSSPRIKLMFPEHTLGTEIQSQPLEDLAKAFENMVAKMVKKSESRFETAHYIKQFDHITAKAIDFSANAQAFLAAVPNVSSKVTETIDSVMTTIDGIASAHPILKIAWFIVSASYKMVSDASKVDDEYSKLPEQFQAILEYVADFLKLPITGIADDKERSNLVKASESIIICLTDAADLFTEYMDTSGTTMSNINGSNKNKLDKLKKRLADVQEVHKNAKDKALFSVAVKTASNVVDIKAVGQDTNAVVHEVKSDTQDIKAILQVQSARDSEKEKKAELKKLQDLCKKRDPHREEVLALANRCAEGTRKWIVDQALEFIENGEEKITWLRCEAGTGKSVIAGLVAKELKKKRLLGATFFCNVNTRENIVCLIQTIAFELANVNDQFRTSLIKTLEDWGFQDVNESKKAMPNTEKLLQLFLPMEAWPKTISVVVVIDALDEIKNIGEDIHLLLGTFLHLDSVKLFITSRPEIKAKSMELSTATKKSSVALMAFQQNDKRNLEDIQLFASFQVDTLFAEFPDFGVDDKEALVDMLVKKSVGLFIWITLVLGTSGGDDEQRGKVADFVEENETHVPKASNQQKMKEEKKEQLIKRLEESASLGLQDLYCRAFSEAFLDGEKTGKKPQLNLFSPSVGTLMVVKVPMSKKGLSSLVQQDKIKPRQISESLDNISALLRVDGKDKLSFIHKTVQDYLIGIALAQDKNCCDNLDSISALLTVDDKMKLSSIDKTVSDYRAGAYLWQLNSHECVKDPGHCMS